MRVARDCESVYQAEADPWNIGDASAPRYQRYQELLTPYAHGSVLDIGCGFGAFLARFKADAKSLDGVDLSHTAVRKGAERFPFIGFHQGSGSELHLVEGIHKRRFDLIICSDVINYFDDKAKARLLDWIAEHLTDTGHALIAAWSPGGKYLTGDELTYLVQKHFVLSHREVLADTEHFALIVRRRRKLVAVTIDYETWHPIPEGKRIDWEADIFAPTERLTDLFDGCGVRGTFFAEMGEYFWLQANKPELAVRMEEQWRGLVSRGHDVQLHLHSNWLPELGARQVEGKWEWDWTKAKAHEYPGDLDALIGRCKAALETAIRPCDPDYRVTTFRAGAYQAQPFDRLGRALIANGVLADSSVYAGGRSDEREYDYSCAYSRQQPYFADLLDPQLKALPAEEKIVELPIFCPQPGRRWFIDGSEGSALATRLIRQDRAFQRCGSFGFRRVKARLTRYASAAYAMAAPYRKVVNRFVPRSVAHKFTQSRTDFLQGDHYYVAIGHTKADLRYDDLEKSFKELCSVPGLEFVTVSQMAEAAQAQLRRGKRTSEKEVEYQVQRESRAVLGEDRNLPQSDYLQQMIPLDASTILDFGCGAGYWSARIAELYPWAHVIGVDAGAAFIDKARATHASARVSFLQGDFSHLSLPDASVDCVYADNTLEHSFDLDAALAEITRVLKEGGVLLAAVPADGLNSAFECDNHTWKTIPTQIAHRLRRTGFTNIRCEEVDTYRTLGMSPYPPSNDRMVYIRAWKGDGDPVKRACRAMEWIYNKVQPTKSNLSIDPKEIINSGSAFCMGYTIALGNLLRREGYRVTWITMLAEDHPRGQGPRQSDTHEILEVDVDGQRYVFDPTANTMFPHSLKELLRNPALADSYANKDARCRERSYELYNTSFWYARVKRVAKRKDPRQRHFWTGVSR